MGLSIAPLALHTISTLEDIRVSVDFEDFRGRNARLGKETIHVGRVHEEGGGEILPAVSGVIVLLEEGRKVVLHVLRARIVLYIPQLLQNLIATSHAFLVP